VVTLAPSCKVLFLCSAGVGIGLGHLQRSLVASKALVDNYAAEVHLIAIGENIPACHVSSFPIRFHATAKGMDVVLEDNLLAYKYQLICFDLFQPSITLLFNNVLAKYQEYGHKVVAIDGLKGCEEFVDLFFVPSFRAPANMARYTSKRLVFGWDCYLLNVDAKPAQGPKQGLLVLTGGSDTTNLGSSWPKLLGDVLPAKTLVNWVSGPFAKSPTLPENSSVVFNVHIAPNGLGPLMQETEVAVTIFGVSFFELIALGVPTVVLSPYGEKDTEELAEIDHLGLALVAKDVKQATDMSVALLSDAKLQARLSSRCSEFITSYSGQRFAKEAYSIISQ
jgi:spore coat polysaccharide biosynthesis predicted glycosyltransferase SpsG